MISFILGWMVGCCLSGVYFNAKDGDRFNVASHLFIGVPASVLLIFELIK